MSETPMTERVKTLVEETTHTVANSPQKLIDASRGAIHMTREEAEHLMDRGEDLFDKLAERGIELERLQSSRVTEWWKGCLLYTSARASGLLPSSPTTSPSATAAGRRRF